MPSMLLNITDTETGPNNNLRHHPITLHLACASLLLAVAAATDCTYFFLALYIKYCFTDQINDESCVPSSQSMQCKLKQKFGKFTSALYIFYTFSVPLHRHPFTNSPHNFTHCTTYALQSIVRTTYMPANYWTFFRGASLRYPPVAPPSTSVKCWRYPKTTSFTLLPSGHFQVLFTKARSHLNLTLQWFRDCSVLS